MRRLLFLVVIAACGGAESAPIEHAPRARGASQPEPDDGLVVEGELGSISRMAVDSTMSNHLEVLGACYRQGVSTLPYLAGEVMLGFRVDRTGHVRWTHVVSSTLGHQETERCLRERAAAIRFPAPQGGEAEFTYPLSFAPGAGRPPDLWTPDRVTEVITEHRQEIETCGVQGQGFSLTMYVNRGGAVAAAGASAPDPGGTSSADCVARAATGWTMPDPGSWVAKVTVELH